MKIRRAVKRKVIEAGSRMAEAAFAGLGVRPPEVLLLLGHMRSGSTLLMHLLLEHPLFSGLGERNATYRGGADLARLAVETRLRRRLGNANIRYVVDQINHTRFTPDTSVFEQRRVRLLFLIRRPIASIGSLLELTRTYYTAWTVRQCVDYYVERLDNLAGFARSLSSPARADFLTYEDLTERAGESLSRLQSVLGTEPAFSETYRTHDFTGKRGDPGANIRSGRIGRGSNRTTPDLPADEVERAQRAHAACLAVMAPISLLPRPNAC